MFDKPSVWLIRITVENMTLSPKYPCPRAVVHLGDPCSLGSILTARIFSRKFKALGCPFQLLVRPKPKRLSYSEFLTVSPNSHLSSNMKFNYYTAILVGLFGTAFSLQLTFDPITQPTKGETIQAGTIYTIKWNASTKGHSGPINILLHNSESPNDLKFIQAISSEGFFFLVLVALYAWLIHKIADTESSNGKFKWNVSSTLPAGERYYIKLDSIADYSIFSESPLFKIKASNKSAGANSSSTTVVTTATSSPSASGVAALDGTATETISTPTSTSSGSDTVMTHVAPATLALVGAVVAGMLVF
jgi:hypothetical protein